MPRSGEGIGIEGSTDKGQLEVFMTSDVHTRKFSRIAYGICRQNIYCVAHMHTIYATHAHTHRHIQYVCITAATHLSDNE